MDGIQQLIRSQIKDMAKYKARAKDKRTTKSMYEDQELECILKNAEEKEEIQRSDLIKRITINKNIKYKNEKQKNLVKLIHEKQIVFIQGPAGTGKSFLSLKAAMEIMKLEMHGINKLMITKPIVEAGEKLGYLPGGIEEKTDPYMNSFIDNIGQIIGKATARDLLANGAIESAPLSYIRGDTFRKSISILDEAQNTSVTAMKLFISRIGGDSKMIIIGDSKQTDLILRGNEKHGLQDAFDRFKGVEGVGHFEFDEDDIVRSKILIELMKRYNND